MGRGHRGRGRERSGCPEGITSPLTGDPTKPTLKVTDGGGGAGRKIFQFTSSVPRTNVSRT